MATKIPTPKRHTASLFIVNLLNNESTGLEILSDRICGRGLCAGPTGGGKESRSSSFCVVRLLTRHSGSHAQTHTALTNTRPVFFFHRLFLSLPCFSSASFALFLLLHCIYDIAFAPGFNNSLLCSRCWQWVGNNAGPPR